MKATLHLVQWYFRKFFSKLCLNYKTLKTFVVESVLELERFSKNAIRQIFNLKPDAQMKKKLLPNNFAILFTNTLMKNRGVSIFLQLCLIINWASGPRLVLISKFPSFFETSPARNTFPTSAGTPKSRFFSRFHQYLSKKYYCGKWSRKSEDS